MLNRGILAVVYSLTVLLGALTLAYPAPSIEGIIGWVLTITYGILLSLGGLAALISIIKPNYKAEMIALWPVAGGYACYAVALWGLFGDRLTHPSGSPAPYGPAIALTVLALFLVAKIGFLMRKNATLIKAVDRDRLA